MDCRAGVVVAGDAPAAAVEKVAVFGEPLPTRGLALELLLFRVLPMWISPHGVNRLLHVIRLYYEIEPIFILATIWTLWLSRRV